jgi:hypothetical protein
VQRKKKSDSGLTKKVTTQCFHDAPTRAIDSQWLQKSWACPQRLPIIRTSQLSLKKLRKCSAALEPCEVTSIRTGLDQRSLRTADPPINNSIYSRFIRMAFPLLSFSR